MVNAPTSPTVPDPQLALASSMRASPSSVCACPDQRRRSTSLTVLSTPHSSSRAAPGQMEESSVLRMPHALVMGPHNEVGDGSSLAPRPDIASGCRRHDRRDLVPCRRVCSRWVSSASPALFDLRRQGGRVRSPWRPVGPVCSTRKPWYRPNGSRLKAVGRPSRRPQPAILFRRIG